MSVCTRLLHARVYSTSKTPSSPQKNKIRDTKINLINCAVLASILRKYVRNWIMRQRDQIFQKKCKKTKARDKMISMTKKISHFLPLYMSHYIWATFMAMHYAKKVNRGEKINLNLCPQNLFATEPMPTKLICKITKDSLYHPPKQKWTRNQLKAILSLY